MPPSPTAPRPSGSSVPLPVGAVLAVLAVVLLGVNLRPGASSVGPVLQELAADLDLSSALAGMLTALPGLCFGVVGLVAVRLGRRAGLSMAIALGLTAVVIGLATRSLVTSAGPFLLLSVLALAGMAVGNVLAPAWVKRHGGTRTVLLMSLYSAMLTVGGSASVLFSAPLAGAAGQLTGDPATGWRYSLAFWALAALAPLVIWALVTRRTGHDFPPAPASTGPARSLVHSPTALFLTALFGLQSMNAYVQFGWMPQILREGGLSASAAGTLTAMIAALGIIGGLVMPTVIDRSSTLAPWMLSFGLLAAAGYTGLLLTGVGLAWLWCLMLGLAGFAFPTAIALIPARSRDPLITARLSGFVQPYGYLLAAAGPLVVGLIRGATGDWTAVLLLLAGGGLLMGAAGLMVSRPVLVDRELEEGHGRG